MLSKSSAKNKKVISEIKKMDIFLAILEKRKKNKKIK